MLVAAALLSAGCSPILYALYRGFRGTATGGALTVGLSVTGDTTEAEDNYQLGCGAPDGAGDQEWSFRAPEAGQYRFTVQGQYDCVVAVYDGESELACNDDTGSTTLSQVSVQLEAGEDYTVVVDGYHGNRGRYSLTVDRGSGPVPGTPSATGAGATSPPTEDPQTVVRRCVQAQRIQPGIVQGSMDPAVATMRTSCGNNGAGGDVLYVLSVTEPSIVTLALTTPFDGVLELRTGCQSAQVVACNDDAGDTRHSRIEGQVGPGEYLLVVDSYTVGAAGAFTLEYAIRPAPAPGQPPPEPTVVPAPGILDQQSGPTEEQPRPAP